MTKGMITVATGSETYYKVAANLLKSYRYYSGNPYPFAILTDEHNEYTDLFDDVIILENPTKSWLDKVYLLNHIPYDETLFIESDCIAYADLNPFIDAFMNADDFSLFGTNHPVDADITYGIKNRKSGKEWGWFDPKIMGKYTKSISYVPQFGSTFVFLRKGEITAKAWEIAKDVWMHSSEYGFRPLDDELLAVSLAASGCKCIPTSRELNMCVVPQMTKGGWKPSPNMHKNRCTFTRPENKKAENALICHWGTKYTKEPLYNREVRILECRLANKGRVCESIIYVMSSIKVYLFSIKVKANTLLKSLKQKIYRIIYR